MKIIDWERKGNLVRLYFGHSDTEFYYPKSWEKSLMNLPSVYDPVDLEDIAMVLDIAFNIEVDVSDIYMGMTMNKDHSKADLVEDKIAPILIIGDTPFYDRAIWHKDIIKIYMGDTLEEIRDIIENKKYVMSYFINEGIKPVAEDDCSMPQIFNTEWVIPFNGVSIGKEIIEEQGE